MGIWEWVMVGGKDWVIEIKRIECNVCWGYVWVGSEEGFVFCMYCWLCVFW